MSLLDYKDIIDNKPVHIATVTPTGDPNLAVASDVNVLDKDTLIISVNEMQHTQQNLQHNPKVVITAFDPDWKGIRIFGTGEFHQEGEPYEYCKRTFFGKGEVSPFGATKPKGAIVIKVRKIADYR